MVVIVILAILAAVVVPAAVSTSDMQASAAARMVASDLQYAQNTAITVQKPIIVSFDPEAESHQLAQGSGVYPYERQLLNHPITKSAHVVDFATQRGFGRVNIVSADFGGDAEVIFDELGTPDTGGRLTVQAGSHVFYVDVASVTGKVAVRSGG